MRNVWLGTDAQISVIFSFSYIVFITNVCSLLRLFTLSYPLLNSLFTWFLFDEQIELEENTIDIQNALTFSWSEVRSVGRLLHGRH